MPDLLIEKPYRYARREGTKTSSFGTQGRINHDSSKFYNSRLYEGMKVDTDIEYKENPVDKSAADRIYCKSSETMNELPDYSVHLMITSPPYNVSKEYDENLTLDEYRQLLKRVFAETYKKLVTGGRACINIANLGRKPYIPLHSYIIKDMQDIGFLMRGEIIWDKASSASPSTAWGSWLSAANPILRDIHEYILVFCKESFSRRRPVGRKSTISKEEFLELTKSVWTFPAESARKIGHPAPFPVELPYRLIQLYTFKDEIVLDPFVGSGSACIAALKGKRHYIGYDINKDYVKLAETRIRQYQENHSAPLFEKEVKNK
jgi:site-specific DNA-methyltransferase (adenine-specific)